MDRDRDGRSRRYDDGEVVRYGAGESWRPTPRGGERSPRRPRSPVRDRARSPPRTRSPRPRSPIIPGSDSYVPGRYPPRRRSRSINDRYRRDRSRDRESSRRRERSRSPMRRSPLPRRSPPRRESPARENRYERPRSPRREWERDRPRDIDHDREWDRERNRPREWERDAERRDDRRSRSPFARDRRRERTPLGKTTPIAVRGGVYRPRSRSPTNRRDDRFHSYKRQSPMREPGLTTTLPSRPASERADSQSQSAKTRSPVTLDGSPLPHRPATPAAAVKDIQRPVANEIASGPSRSPPRGPAALRPPPVGPAAGRTLSTSATMPIPQTQRVPQTPNAMPHRTDTTSPTNPPSGPRGYIPLNRASSFSSRGGRGGWNSAPPRHLSGPPPASGATSGPSNIPTGPRASISNGSGAGMGPTQRPFNPPTGPSAQHGSGPRQTLAQSLLSTMPPLIPGGKTDPSMTPLTLGVTKEIEGHYRKLKDEEEKIREDLRLKQERLRKSLYSWSRLERDARAWEMRSDLSEKSMKNLAGEGVGGAAF